MICRISALLESVHAPVSSSDQASAILVFGEGTGVGAEVAREVLLPSYLAAGLASRVGQRVTLVTIEYLEGQGQGTSFIPRLIGFESAADRDFFELFTTVKGIGNRRALRAMAKPPGVIARAVAERDAKSLTQLPEIGKRLAETVIAELHGKVDGYLSEAERGSLEIKSQALGAGRLHGSTALGESLAQALGAGHEALTPVGEEAAAVLVALGETRADAERKIVTVLDRLRRHGRALPTTPDELVAQIFSGGAAPGSGLGSSVGKKG